LYPSYGGELDSARLIENQEKEKGLHLNGDELNSTEKKQK
jgi:hypothetical protein